MKINYYEVLGVDRSASEQQIRERFRKLARENHPDRYVDGEKAEAERKFQTLTEAVNVLTNPVRRKQHTESYKDWKVGETRMYPMICPTKMKALSGGATSDNPNVVIQASQIKLDTSGPPFVQESHKIYITVRRVPSVSEIEMIAKGSSPPAIAVNVTYWSICLD